MSSSAVRRVHEVFERFEARDVEGVVGLFAADGVFADPHYPPPIGPAMVGHLAIREGLFWGLTIVDQPHFAVRHELAGDSDAVAAFEVDTNHHLVGAAPWCSPRCSWPRSTVTACSAACRPTRPTRLRPSPDAPAVLAELRPRRHRSQHAVAGG